MTRILTGGGGGGQPKLGAQNTESSLSLAATQGSIKHVPLSPKFPDKKRHVTSWRAAL